MLLAVSGLDSQGTAVPLDKGKTAQAACDFLGGGMSSILCSWQVWFPPFPVEATQQAAAGVPTN